MTSKFKNGVWPVMLTPFTNENEIDYTCLKRLVDWYIENNVSGLFAVCQSSEMFFLSLQERVALAEAVKKYSDGRVQVIASGHVSESISSQIEEINAIAETGVDAVILITNRLAKQEENDDVWIKNLNKVLDKIDPDIPLGLYECPYPYKRIMSEKTTKWCAESGRFYFLKDTSCDIGNIKMKLEIIKGTNLRLFNANTSTLLESLKLGAAGYSGIMANIHPRLYNYLCKNYSQNNNAEKILKLSDELTMLSLIEKQLYPVNAKYYLTLEGLEMRTASRVQKDCNLTDTYKKEIEALRRISERLYKEYPD